MLKVTLDFNAVIDLENHDPTWYPVLHSVVEMHQLGKIDLAIPGIAANERPKKGLQFHNFSDFQKRIKELSTWEITILKPMAMWNFTFWDWSVWSDEDMEKLDENIHSILFLKIPFLWRDYAILHQLDPEMPEVAGKWRNARCDTISLWCHIYYQRDIFITRDDHFFKKKDELLQLGARNICMPDEALQIIDNKIN